METITSSATKRKKRKTRKCLDEIRKRSRCGTKDPIKKTPVLGKLREIVSNVNDPRKPISNNNYITSNRLTLAMFPKAIRSETITRPVLSDIQHGACNYNLSKVVTNGRPPNAVLYNDNNAQPDGDSDFIKNSDEESMSSAYDKCNEIQKDSTSENRSNGGISPRSFILFSPMHQAAENDLIEESPNEHFVSTPTSSSQSVRECYGYQLYEEFMNEIPIYLRENAPALLKEDVMKKTRTVLHNIYMHNCRRGCEDNILQCIKTSVSASNKSNHDTIVRNPMDYLKLGYSWQQTTEPAPPLAADSTVESPAPAPQSLIHDTPEYTYYPHKLNQ